MSKLANVDLLRQMSFDDLMVTYRRCKANSGVEAKKIIEIIEDNNLLVPRGGGLPGDHPVIEQMKEILRRPGIRDALKVATCAGLPALSAVDSVLKQEIGTYYGLFDTASWAGTLVADEMRRMGYKEKSKKPLPEGSVVKMGAFFIESHDISKL